MVASAVLLDTDVLLNATAPARPMHSSALGVLNEWPNQGVGLCTSGQILREYLVVATRGVEHNGLGLSLEDAVANRDMLEARMQFLDETQAVAVRLRELVHETACVGKQIHDANVAATAISHGVGRILTGNTSDFAKFRDFIEIIALAEV